MDVLLIHPPATKPAEPPLGAAVLLGHLRRAGVGADAIDANLEAYEYLLQPDRLAAAAGAQPPTALKRAVRHARDSLATLRSPDGARSFARYCTAVHHLNTALGAYALARPDEQLTLGDYVHGGLSAFAPADLARVARGDAGTVFGEYFRDSLVPRVAPLRPRLIALSINYRHQVLPAFELAGLLRRALPEARLVAGGGMISSWAPTLRRLGLKLDAFDHLVFGPGEAALTALARGAAAPHLLEDSSEVAFDPDFSFAPARYLSPEPVLPLSATRGCYWRGCLFCPESVAPTHPYRCGSPRNFVDGLEALARERGVRHFHLTDNALPLNILRELAAAGPRLRALAWHGFVRFERALADPRLIDGLAAAGCGLLQLGLESGSQRVLDRLGKGTRLEDVSRILEELARAKIDTYVYVMLGTPGETEEDARRTRDFLEAHAPQIGFLNLAIMNLPRDAALLDEPQRHGIRSAALLGDEAEEPLALYQSFEPEGGWDRAAARRFLNAELLGSPAIREIVNRTPPFFSSNHAFFFPRWPEGGGPS